MFYIYLYIVFNNCVMGNLILALKDTPPRLSVPAPVFLLNMFRHQNEIDAYSFCTTATPNDLFLVKQPSKYKILHVTSSRQAFEFTQNNYSNVFCSLCVGKCLNCWENHDFFSVCVSGFRYGDTHYNLRKKRLWKSFLC